MTRFNPKRSFNGNQNHPRPGSTIKVEPIRSLKDIKLIRRLLADKPRDECLFTLGINTNLRASDLVRITAGQVRGLKEGDEIEIHPLGQSRLEVGRSEADRRFLERLRSFRGTLPADFRFDRLEANDCD